MTHRRALALELRSWRSRRKAIRAYNARWDRGAIHLVQTMTAANWPPTLAAYDDALSFLESLCPGMGDIDAEDRCTLALATLRAFATALTRQSPTLLVGREREGGTLAPADRSAEQTGMHMSGGA